MIDQSGIVVQTGQANRQTVIDPADSRVVIPNLLSPVIEPIARTVYPPETTGPFEARDSFVYQDHRFVANAAALDQILFWLTPGVWRLNVDTFYCSNYAHGGGQPQWVGFVSPIGLNAVHAYMDRLGNLQAGKNSTLRVNVQVEFQDFVLHLDANGVGQFHEMSVCVIAEKLT